MPTTFETLLNLRLWQEDEAKSYLASALRELSEAEYELAVLNQRYEDLSRQAQEKSNTTLFSEDYHRYSAEIEYLLKEIESKEKLVKEKEAVVATARELLNEAVVQRKIFQRLVQKQKDQRQKELLKKEQNSADEASNIKFITGQ